MKTLITLFVLLLIGVASASGQNPGTLKIFSEEPVVVYVDEIQHPDYQAISLPSGTHYVKALNRDGARIYSNIVTIKAGEVTSVLIDAEGTATQPAAKTAAQPSTTAGALPAAQGIPSSAKGTGTLNIFSEFNGVTIYLDDNRQGDDVKVINSIPAGNHYLKVMKDGVSIFGELIAINPCQTTVF